MTDRRSYSKPTCVEFFTLLAVPRSDLPTLRLQYCTLRRRGLGQTSAGIAALLALRYTLKEIATALGRNRRRVWENWSRIRKKFELDSVDELREFLEDTHAGPEGRRSKPTPQQRPFERPSSSDKRPIRRSGSILFDGSQKRSTIGRRDSSDDLPRHRPPEQPSGSSG